MIVGGVEVRVDLRSITSLLPHEETIPELTLRLTRVILSDSVQRDPVVVDVGTGTVLDGMHRMSALRQLRARNIVCHLVDYASPGVRLRRWIRVLRRTGEGAVLPLLGSLGISRIVSTEQAFELVEGRGRYIALLAAGKSYVPARALRSTEECYEILRKIDAVGRQLGWKEDFVDEENLDVELSSLRSVVVLTPKISKRDVLEAARTRRLLPHKMTRHVIDLRPLGIDYPLSELRKERPSKEMLIDKLTNSRVSIMNPPYTYLGRTYEERVMVLEKR